MIDRSAVICSQIEPDESARRAPAYARVEDDVSILGNGFLEAQINISGRERETAVFLNKITGEKCPLAFSPIRIWRDGTPIDASEGKTGRPEALGSSNVSSLTTRISMGWCDAEVSYVLSRGEHFLRKNVVFHRVKERTYIDRVSLFQHDVLPEYEVLLHDGGLYSPLLFLRSKKGGVFFCMDFPGYFVSLEGRSFQFDYYPGKTIEPGRSFQTLTAHVGVYALAGRGRANPYHETGAALDVGEQQWFREYVLLNGQPASLPVTEVRAPSRGIAGPSELEAIEQCAWFGAKHISMPRVTSSWDSYPLAETVKKRMEEQGISAALRLSPEMTGNLRWVALAPDGSSAAPGMDACFASEEFCNDLVERYVEKLERYGFRSINITGGPLVACHSTGHGHAPGVESIQMAFQGLAEVIGALKENFAHVNCSRPYGSYGVGLARFCDAISIVANEHPLPLPDIHIARQFADMGRLYFRRSHSFLLPRTKLANSVGVTPESSPDAPYPGTEYFPWYLYHDSAGWRYSLLSAIATCLRHRFYALPQDLNEADRAFAQKWLAWERERLTRFPHVEEILDEPGLGNVDGYSYAGPRGAIIFLFNCSYDSKDVSLRLQLSYDSDYIVREIYPRELNYIGPNDGLFRRDSLVQVSLEPKEARIVEVVRRSPASAKRKRPEVFGVEGQETASGVQVRGKAGSHVRIGVRIGDRFLEEEIRFSGPCCPRHLQNWVYTQRSFEDGVAGLPQGAFAGTPTTEATRNVWLCARLSIPKEFEQYVDRSPFVLNRPCWAFPERLFFVVRFEPVPAFDPIRTSSGVSGVPEGYRDRVPMKCGIDLTQANLALHAWINGEEREVYPAIASWKGYRTNPNPIVAYFFEAGSKLDFGGRNHVVLFASHFDPTAFQGVYMEHLPELTVEKALEFS